MADKPTVLVVEDSPTQRIQLEYLLQEAGFRVITAPHGAAGLAAAKTEALDLVITDVVMPEMDGYELCRALRDEPNLSALPVVLLTSLSDVVDVVRALEAGANAFISKPYKEASLLERIRNILINQQLRESHPLSSEAPVPVAFAGQRFHIGADRTQILDLLLSTYEDTVAYNSELVRAQDQLRELNEKLEEMVAQRTAALTQSEAKYRALAESSPDALFVIGPGPEHLILEANLVALELYGYSRTELLALDAVKLFANEAAHAFVDCLQVLAQSDTSVESVHQARDGECFPVEMKAQPLDFDGKECLMASVRDISDRRRAEKERHRLEEHLRTTQRIESIGLLAGGVAHDFNNLLSVILSYTGLAREAVEDPDVSSDLFEVQKAAERAADLTRRLLTFSRKQGLKSSPMDLNELIEGLEKMLRRMVSEDIAIEKDLAPGIAQISADARQIEGVLMNLVVNARDATPSGGSITIRTSPFQVTEDWLSSHREWNMELGDYVRLEVEDTGCGMSEEVVARIMEPFFTTKEPGKGTGLGLATVYGAVTQSGGCILVESSLGQGSTFTILLPVVPEVEPVQDATNESLSTRRTGDETVLVVEDEASLLALAKRLLTQSGYTVLAAANGAQALEVYEQYPEEIHLLMTDVVMPGLSGVALARRISEEQPGIKILFMSGYTSESLVSRGTPVDRDHFLAKPFSPDDLLKKVRAVLDAPADPHSNELAENEEHR